MKFLETIERNPMGEIIEVRLSDEQHRQLMSEAREAGQKFFDYCRTKLTARPAVSTRREVVEVVEGNTKTVSTFPAYDAPPTDPQAARLDRLEGLMARVLDHLEGATVEPDDGDDGNHPRAMGTRGDFEAVMQRALGEADAQGLTRPQAEPSREMTPDEEDYAMIGVRPYRKPSAPSFSAHGTSNRIIREATSTVRI